MTMTISRTGGIVQTMKFTLEASSRVNLIRAYSAQEIRVGEHLLHASCIITADTLVSEWEPASFADLTLAHLEAILALKPEVVLLGTGPTQRFPPAAIRAALTERGVGLEVMDLGAACRTFNILVQEERQVAAALFLS
jgi:uncharacterized protein